MSTVMHWKYKEKLYKLELNQSKQAQPGMFQQLDELRAL